MADFKYVIQTDLQLSASSVNKLLEDVASTDRRIKEKMAAIQVGLRLNSNDKRIVQEQIGKMKATMPVSLRLDRSSLSAFKREIDVVIANAKRELAVAIQVQQQAPARNTPNTGPAALPAAIQARRETMRRLPAPGAAGVNQNQGQAVDASIRAMNASSRAMNAETNRLVYALREQINEANRKLKEAKTATEQERLLAQTYRKQREAINLEETQRRQQKRLEAGNAKQGGSASAQSVGVHNAVLRNPDASEGERIKALNALKQEASAAAQALGEKLYRSWEITRRAADGSITKTRTATFEFNEMGKVIDRANRSLTDLGNLMGKNMLFYTGINAGFNAITNSIQSSIAQMAAFESAYQRIINISKSRNSDEDLAKVNGTSTAYAHNRPKKDILDIGQRYGLNPNDDVMPIYRDIMSRKDISHNAQEAKKLTTLVVRAGMATGGNDVQGSDLQSIGKDFTSIYAQMYKTWSDNGRSNELAIRRMSNFVDSLAAMSSEGADIDKSMDAIADLVPYVTGDGRMDINFLASLVGKAQEQMGDSSGAAISSTLKTMFANLTKTGDGNTGSNEARRILGTSSEMSLQAQLAVLAGRMTEEGYTSQDGSVHLEKLTEGEIGELARQLASSSGGGSGTRQAEFRKIIEVLPHANDLYEKTLNAQGEAEKQAIAYSKTLRGEWQKLVAQLQELAVNIGDSGVLNGFKLMVGAVDMLVSSVNTLLRTLSQLGDVTKGIFGEELGAEINNYASTVASSALLYGSLFMGGKAIYGKWFKGNGSSLGTTGSGGGSVAAGGSAAAALANAALLALPLGNQTVQTKPLDDAGRRALNSGTYGPQFKPNGYGINGQILTVPGRGVGGRVADALHGPRYNAEVTAGGGKTRVQYVNFNGNLANRTVPGQVLLRNTEQGLLYRGSQAASNAAAATRGAVSGIGSAASRAGNAVATGLNAAWLFSTFRKGPGSVASAAGETGKFAKAMEAILPKLKVFGALLARLSIWGAAIGGVAFVANRVHQSFEKNQKKAAESFNTTFSDEKASKETFSKIDTIKGMISEGMPAGLDAQGQAEYRNTRQNELLDYYIFGKNNPYGLTDEKKYDDSLKFNMILEELLNDSNFYLDRSKEAGTFDYQFQDSVEGKRKSGTLELFSNDKDKNLESLKIKTEGILNGTGQLAEEWEKINGDLDYYAKSLATISKIQERLNKVAEVQSIRTSLNNTMFSGGGESSAAYYKAELANVTNSIQYMSSDYDKLKAENDAIISSQKRNSQRSYLAQLELGATKDGGTAIQEITDAFNAAKEAGAASTFAQTYSVSGDPTPEQRFSYNFAKSLADDYLSQQAMEESKKSISEIVSSISQQVASLKQLQVAYLVASSGAGAFEGAMKQLQSTVAQDTHKVNMADNYESRKIAMENSFSSMAQEVRMYQAQTQQLQASMDAIKELNPNQDFSIGALYNPGPDGISAEQGAVKQLMEMQLESQAGQNASLEALKQQIDAMKELVLTSDKYKDMWESVNERIELSKSLSKEIRDITAGTKIAPDMAKMKAAFVPDFKQGEYMQQQYESSRDSYIQVSEQIRKSFVTYGSDADKLKEALAEIKGSYTDKIKAAFLDPLKDIVDTDMQAVSDAQMEAAKSMQDSMSLLNSILNTNLQALQDAISLIPDASTTSMTSESITAMPQTFDATTEEGRKAILGLGFGPLTPEAASKATDNSPAAGLGLSNIPGIKDLGNKAILSLGKGPLTPAAAAKASDKSPLAALGLSNVPGINLSTQPKTTSGTSSKSQSQALSGQEGVNANRGQLANKNLKLQTAVTAADIDAYIAKKAPKDSSMRGMGYAFIEAAKQSGLDPVFLMALAAEESGWGKAGTIARDKNAVYSIGANDRNPRGDAYSYDSIEQSIIEGANWIAKNYTNKGQNTIQKMRANGGTHEYNSRDSWVNNLTSIMAGFGKNAVSGNEATTTTVSQTASAAPVKSTALDNLLSALAKEDANPKWKYENVNGKYKGTYDQFVNNAIADCSQFVQEMFGKWLGIELPRTAREQYDDPRAEKVSRENIQAGDLLFFNTASNNKTASHVGISTGGTKFIQMGTSGLKEGDLNSNYWGSQFDGARRFPGTGSASVLENMISGVGADPMAEQRAAEEAFKQLLEQAAISVKGTFVSGHQALMSQKNTIKFGTEQTLGDYAANMNINRQGKYDYKNFEAETIQGSRLQIQSAIQANKSFMESAPKYLKQLAKDANDTTKSSADRQVASAQYNALNNLLKDGKYIKSMEKNTKYLEILADRYAAIAYKDPNYNATEATKLIQGELKGLLRMDKAGKGGSIEYYQKMQTINDMDANYMSRKKQTEIRQEVFDNHGYGYQDLYESKKLQRKQDVFLLEKQMANVARTLEKITAGTNNWYLVLEDAVALQEKVVEMENKKTELSKKYFEQTSQGVYAYINARAYTQSRDYVLTGSNLKAATNKYHSSKSGMDANEQLVNLQIISESHDKMISVMNDYRSAVVGAFKAGAIGVTEYMERLNNLRDMQDEIRTQAVNMTDAMQDTFSSSLADALKSGMEGSFDAPEQFIQSIKSGLASSVSAQMSNIVLQQSGLQDTMNGLVKNMVISLTTGDANKSINAFNTNDFKKQIDGALSPFLPLIQQITASTDGIFGVLKDQLFNAPSGFKIDSYIYDIEKAKTALELGKWGYADGTKINEAGSPTAPGSKDSGKIVLPPMANVPTGVPNFVTKPIEHVLSDGGSLRTPFQKGVTWNPVKEILNGIIDTKESYNGSIGKDTDGKKLSHEQANLLRATLKEIPGTEDIVKALGDGVSPKSLGIDGIQKLLSDSKLNEFNMTRYLDGIDSGVDGMSNTLADRIDGVISGVGGVITAINAANAVAAPLPTNSGSGTGPVSSIPTGISTPITATPGSSTGSTTTGAGKIPVGISNPTTAITGVKPSSSGNTSSGISSPTTVGGGSSSSSGSSQQAYLDSLKSSSNQQAANWANQYQYLNNLTKSSNAQQAAWAESQMAKNNMPKYHSGGIGGALNFANADRLSSNEFNAILQNDETIFQKGQLGSFLQHFIEGGSSKAPMASSGGTNVSVSVQVDGAGSDESLYQEVISRAVTAAVQEVKRQKRLDSLQTKGAVVY